MHPGAIGAVAFLLLSAIPIFAHSDHEGNDHSPMVQSSGIEATSKTGLSTWASFLGNMRSHGRGGKSIAKPVVSFSPSGSTLPSIEPTTSPSRSDSRIKMPNLSSPSRHEIYMGGMVEGKSKRKGGEKEAKSPSMIHSGPFSATGAMEDVEKMKKGKTMGSMFVKAPLYFTSSPSGSTLPSYFPSVLSLPSPLPFKMQSGGPLGKSKGHDNKGMD